jgi:hypothetical protein
MLAEDDELQANSASRVNRERRTKGAKVMDRDEKKDRERTCAAAAAAVVGVAVAD